MKVTLLKEDKKHITLADAPIARQIIVDMKEDKSTPAEYAGMAIRAAYNGSTNDVEILKASTKISTNCRAVDVYTENSGHLDIWIDATAHVNGNEFVIIGAYLSDIWQITGCNNEEVSAHMYVRKFQEVK